MHRIKSLSRATSLLLLSWLVSLTTGCQTTRPPVSAQPALPTAFSQSGQEPAASRWWESFGDRHLNALVEAALAENLSLETAWQRLRQARAVAVQAGAAKGFTLDGSSGLSRSERKPVDQSSTVTWEGSLGLAAGYEVDLWGRLEASAEAARMDVEASTETLQATAIALTANVVSAWLQLSETRGQLALVAEQQRTNEDYLAAITQRFRSGQAAAADVLQQRQLVEAANGELAQLQGTAAVLEHALAVLLGRAPGGLPPSGAMTIPALPPLPATGLPAELVTRRPDLRAAFASLHAADQRVAVAIAERFPRLSLAVSGETAVADWRDLFAGWATRLAANLSAPLLDGGRRRAEVTRTEAVLAERVAAYELAILEALQEVEDALVQEAHQADYVASLQRQLALATQASEQTRERYLQGTRDFTRYLSSLQATQSLQRRLLSARRQLLAYRVAVHLALAGGWEVETTFEAPPEADASEPLEKVGDQ